MNVFIVDFICKMQVIRILGLEPYYTASRIFEKIKKGPSQKKLIQN